MTIDDVLDLAFNASSLPTLQRKKVNRQAAIFRYWKEHREVGTPLTNEMPLEDGSTAVITSTGRVLHWTQGDAVEVL